MEKEKLLQKAEKSSKVEKGLVKDAESVTPEGE